METITQSLSERIRELRTREPILSTTATRVAIDLLNARLTALEDAFLQLSEAGREPTNPHAAAGDSA